MGVATPFVLEMNLNCATFSMPRMRHILCWTHRMELMLANTLVTKPANTFTWFVRHASQR
jgi:hypothetical protein